MSEREKYEALAQELTHAVNEAIDNPCPENLREVSKFINACNAQRDAAKREMGRGQ